MPYLTWYQFLHSWAELKWTDLSLWPSPWQGETNTNIAIDSIVAVPYNQWHQDLVQPQRVCTMENGECVQAFYRTPPDTTKVLNYTLTSMASVVHSGFIPLSLRALLCSPNIIIHHWIAKFPPFCIPNQVEFESNIEGKVAAEGPPGVSNMTSLVYLNHSDPMVDITGKLRKAGQYVFVIHYFQPHYPGESVVMRAVKTLFTFLLAQSVRIGCLPFSLSDYHPLMFPLFILLFLFVHCLQKHFSGKLVRVS